MNHCLIEAKVKKVATIRYTQENQTPIAEMEVLIQGLRADDPPGSLKVVGWGNIAQELQNRFQVGEKVILEGRMRMNVFTKQDGTKEKKAELTLSKEHTFSEEKIDSNNFTNEANGQSSQSSQKAGHQDVPAQAQEESISWDSSPLIPDTDDIPF